MVPDPESPDVLGLQIPEAFTTSCAGQDFWETQGWNHYYRVVVATTCTVVPRLTMLIRSSKIAVERKRCKAK